MPRGQDRRTFAPEFEASRPRAAQRQVAQRLRVRAQTELEGSPGQTVFEAASQSRRARGWIAPTTSPNSALLASLTTLRDRSRSAVRNDGIAKGAVDHLVTNLVGTGIQPLSKAEDTTFRKDVQALFKRWTDECDADGLLDYYGLQTQATRCWVEAGEVFIRLRPRRLEDGLSVPLQLQVVEPELCPHMTMQATITRTGAKVRGGIEFNSIGRRVAYWFHPSRTTDPDEIDYSQLVRVPADRVIHLYDPLRPGQLRGLPLLTPALVRLHELDKFDDAVLLNQQLSNMFVGFVKTPSTLDGNAEMDPLSGLPLDTSDPNDDRPMVGLEPGLFQHLDPGDDVTFSQPPAVPETYPDFMRQQLIAVSAATGVPYEVLTGDMSKVNDRTVRVILQEFRRRITAWQHQVLGYQLCRRVWNEWIAQVFLAGALDIPAEAFVQNPEPWTRVEWKPQGFPYINPVQDQQAAREAVRDGMTSRAAVVAERGDDVEEVDREQAEDNARADELGLAHDSDGRRSLKAGVTSAPNPDDAPAGQPAAQPAEEAA